MKASGNWKEDFFQVFRVCEGISQVVHVFVPQDESQPVRGVPVGPPISDETIDAAMRYLH